MSTSVRPARFATQTGQQLRKVWTASSVQHIERLTPFSVGVMAERVGFEPDHLL